MLFLIDTASTPKYLALTDVGGCLANLPGLLELGGTQIEEHGAGSNALFVDLSRGREKVNFVSARLA